MAKYPTRSYCGQYSEGEKIVHVSLSSSAYKPPTLPDSSFFYTCTQDFRVHMYDTTANSYKQVHRYEDSHRYSRSTYYASSNTTHLTSLKSIKTIQGRQGSWTITGEIKEERGAVSAWLLTSPWYAKTPTCHRTTNG